MDAVSFNSLEAVQFGEWRLTPKKQTITDGEVSRELKPLIYNLLTYLLQNQDRIVTRQELIDFVWRQSFVDDNAINRALSELRKELKSDRQRGVVIKTHYRKGFSIIVDVEFIASNDKPIQKTAENTALHTETAKSVVTQSDGSQSNPANSQFEQNAVEDSVVKDGVVEQSVVEDSNANQNHLNHSQSQTNETVAVSNGNGAETGAKNRNNRLIVATILFVICAAVVFFAFSSNPLQKKRSEVTPTEEVLTWDNGRVVTPFASKNGELIAYTINDYVKEESKLVVKSLKTKQLVNVYVPAKQYDEAFPIAWSKQSEVYYQVVNYRSDIKCEIWKAKITDDIFNAPTQLVTNKLFDCKSQNVINGDILNDDNTLIYSKYYYRSKRAVSRLVSRNLTTGDEYQVSTPNLGYIGDTYVKVDHAEERMAYLRFNPARTQIYIANVDGSEPLEIADLNEYIHAISWSSDDNSLLWISGSSPQYQLSEYNTDTGEKHVTLVNIERELKSWYGRDLIDDKYLIAVSDESETQVKAIDVSADKAIEVPYANLPDNEWWGTPFNHSPRYLFFNDHKTPSLWLYDNNISSKIGEIDEANYADMSISPDDQQIVLAEGSALHVYAIDTFKKVDTIDVRSPIKTAIWLDTNKLLLVLIDQKNQSNLYRYDLETGLLTKLAQPGVLGVVAKNATHFYYLDANSHLYLYNTLTNQGELLNKFHEDELYVWTVIGDNFYFTDSTLKKVSRMSMQTFENPVVIYECNVEMIYDIFNSNDINRNAIYLGTRIPKTTHLYRYNLAPTATQPTN